MRNLGPAISTLGISPEFPILSLFRLDLKMLKVVLFLQEALVKGAVKFTMQFISWQDYLKTVVYIKVFKQTD